MKAFITSERVEGKGSVGKGKSCDVGQSDSRRPSEGHKHLHPCLSPSATVANAKDYVGCARFHSLTLRYIVGRLRDMTYNRKRFYSDFDF